MLVLYYSFLFFLGYVDDIVLLLELHPAVDIYTVKDLFQSLVIGEPGEVSGLSKRLVKQHHLDSEQALKIRGDVAEAKVEEVDGAIIMESLV